MDTISNVIKAMIARVSAKRPNCNIVVPQKVYIEMQADQRTACISR